MRHEGLEFIYNFLILWPNGLEGGLELAGPKTCSVPISRFELETIRILLRLQELPEITDFLLVDEQLFKEEKESSKFSFLSY